jgi:hypothetical protein
MHRTRVAWFAAAAIAALLLANGSHAQSVNFAVTGKVTAVDTAAKTISVKGANDDGGTYHVNADTSIMLEKKKLGLGDVKVGWHVVLNGDSGLDGKTKRATYIEVVDTSSY